MNRHRIHTAAIWKHFEICDQENRRAVCHHCKNILSYKSTITNLKLHLKKKHEEVYESYSHLEKIKQGNQRKDSIFTSESSLDGNEGNNAEDSSQNQIIFLETDDGVGHKNPIEVNTDFQDSVYFENDSENGDGDKGIENIKKQEPQPIPRRKRRLSVLYPVKNVLTSVEFDKLNLTQNPLEMQKIQMKLELRMKAAEHEQKLENLRNEDRRREEQHRVIMAYLKGLCKSGSDKLLFNIIKS